MSIKGFSVSGVTDRYDYNYLDNKPEIHSIPTGGTAGQVLAKRSGADYAVEWADQTGGGGDITVDDVLSNTSENPVQNKVITAALATKADQAGIQQVIEDEVDDWLSVQAPSIGTLSYAAKQALLACFRHVAWIDDQGQSYYNALESELFPDTALESITAVFTPEQAAPVTIDPTRVSAYITTDGRWLASSDAYSVCVPVTSGKRYKFQFTSTSSTDVGTIFRFGFSDTNTPTEQTLIGLLRSTPQDYVATEITASGSYLVIQLSASVAPSVISNGFLSLTELGTVIYDTDNLNTLRQYLVVTATYSDSSTATVTDYTLSGTLAVGTSTITASYGGKTDTFSVTVVKYWDISWDYTMGTPIGNGWKTGTSLPGVMESDGFKLSSTSSAGGEFAHDPNIEDTEGIFEVDLTLSQIGSTYQGFCIFSPGMRLRIYSGKLWFNGSSTNTQTSQTQIASISANTKYTIRWEYVKANFARVYVDGTLVHTQSSALADSTTRLFVNNTPSSSAVATIHAIRFREVS